MDLTEYKEIKLNKWVLNTLYGWLMGFVFIVILALILDTIGVSSQFFVGTGIAAGVGFMQNKILRSHRGWGWNWMWATIVGVTLGFLVVEYGAIPFYENPVFNLQLAVSVGGLFAGILQYLMLRSKSISNSLVWIVYSVIGWSLAAFCVGFTDLFKDFLPNGQISLVLNLPLMLFASSLVLGWITAKGIKRLLH